MRTYTNRPDLENCVIANPPALTGMNSRGQELAECDRFLRTCIPGLTEVLRMEVPIGGSGDKGKDTARRERTLAILRGEK